MLKPCCSAIHKLLDATVVVEEDGAAVLPRIIAVGGRFAFIHGKRHFLVPLALLTEGFLAGGAKCSHNTKVCLVAHHHHPQPAFAHARQSTHLPTNVGCPQIREMFNKTPSLGLFSFQARAFILTPRTAGKQVVALLSGAVPGSSRRHCNMLKAARKWWGC